MAFTQVDEAYISREFAHDFHGGMPDALRGHEWYILQAFIGEIVEAMEAFDNHDVCLDKLLEDDYLVVALGVKSEVIYVQPQLF